MWKISSERSRARFLARFSRFLVIWEVKNLRNLAGIWLACVSGARCMCARNGRVEADEFAALTSEQGAVVRRMYETVRHGL